MLLYLFSFFLLSIVYDSIIQQRPMLGSQQKHYTALTKISSKDKLNCAATNEELMLSNLIFNF